MKLVLTCEHAFNTIPNKYKHIFNGENEVLHTHEAFDPGAHDLFESLESLADFSHFQSISRLLIETNRSIGHASLYSRFTKQLPEADKKYLLEAYYLPYRRRVQTTIEDYIENGHQVLHLSIHSFTPILKGIERHNDIGLLYDPKRENEKLFCAKFKQLLTHSTDLKIRYNYPYLGKSDGFTTYLRKTFPQKYMGIEIEVNQKFVANNKFPSGLKRQVYGAIKSGITA